MGSHQCSGSTNPPDATIKFFHSVPRIKGILWLRDLPEVDRSISVRNDKLDVDLTMPPMQSRLFVSMKTPLSDTAPWLVMRAKRDYLLAGVTKIRRSRSRWTTGRIQLPPQRRIRWMSLLGPAKRQISIDIAKLSKDCSLTVCPRIVSSGSTPPSM